MPTVPHGDVTEAPTMATMMLVLCTMQSTNQAILNRLDAMDNTSKKHHGRLRAAINSKADSAEIARLDHQLEVMAQTIWDDVNNQLTLARTSIVDIKANLSHLTKTHAAHLEKLDNMLVDQHACLDTYSTLYDGRFAALEQRLSTPKNPPCTTVVDPSLRGCNSSPSQFPSAVLPEGRVDDAPGPDSANDEDDAVEVVGTLPLPRAPHRTVYNNTTQVISRRSMDPTGVLPEDSTFTLLSGHFGSGLGGPTVNITSPRRDEQGANAHAAHMAGPAGAHLREASPHTPSRPVTRPPHITPPIHPSGIRCGSYSGSSVVALYWR